MDVYLTLKNFLAEWTHLEERRFSAGTICIGPPTHPGKMDYLFCVHSPLRPQEIADMEADLQEPIHPDLKRFYRHANGFTAFSGWLNLFGHRRVMRASDMELILDQPFDLVIENDDDARRRKGALKISGYSDGSGIYLRQDGECYVLSPSGENICRWPNLATWLNTELHRFASFLDHGGRSKIAFSKIPSPRTLS